MSLDKLLSSINEYNNLLGFLYEKHPQVLKEWSNGALHATTLTTHTNDQEGRIDYE